MTICKFLINKHTNICVDVCRNGSCQGDQTMLGAWQSERGKTWRKKPYLWLLCLFLHVLLKPPCMVPWQPPCLTAIHTRCFLSLELTQKIFPLDELWPYHISQSYHLPWLNKTFINLRYMAAKCSNAHSQPTTCMSNFDMVKIRWQQLYKLWKVQSTLHNEQHPGKYTVRQVGKNGNLCITLCA